MSPILTQKPFRRQGIATYLYAYGAKYLGAMGMTLKGTSLQQPAATALWEKMGPHPSTPLSLL